MFVVEYSNEIHNKQKPLPATTKLTLRNHTF